MYVRRCLSCVVYSVLFVACLFVVCWLWFVVCCVDVCGLLFALLFLFGFVACCVLIAIRCLLLVV